MNIKNLTVLKNDDTELLKGISFSAEEGDRVAIIGEEGNGKSTLIKIIYGDSSVKENFKITGKVDLMGRIPAYLPQHLPEKWLDTEITDFLLKEEPQDEVSPEDYNRLSYIYEKSSELGIKTELIGKTGPMRHLSGGERVAVQLLKIISSPYTLLLLDEPTNDLDIESLEFLGEFIKKEENPVIFISHDETLLSEAATSILHLEQVNMKTKRRCTFFKGDYKEYLSRRQSQYHKALQISASEKSSYLKKKERLNDIMNAVHHAQNAISRKDPSGGRLLKKKMHAVKSMEKRFEKEGYSTVDHPEEEINVFFPETKFSPDKVIINGTPEIKVEGILLIEKSDFIIKGQEKVVITGPNGCGKSLLLRSLVEILSKRDDIRVGYMPQNYMNILSKAETCLQYLLTDHSKDDITRSLELMGAMKFTREEMGSSPFKLSDGQKAKLFILKFIKDGSDVLILDEPTRNFSPLSAPVIRNILDEYGGTIISVSHDRTYITESCDRVIEVKDKKLAEKF